MRCWLQVETLKMGWCNVGPDDGAKAVADLLMFNSTVKTLDLRGNGLGDAGVQILSVLPYASVLSWLPCRENAYQLINPLHRTCTNHQARAAWY